MQLKICLFQSTSVSKPNAALEADCWSADPQFLDVYLQLLHFSNSRVTPTTIMSINGNMKKYEDSNFYMIDI